VTNSQEDFFEFIKGVRLPGHSKIGPDLWEFASHAGGDYLLANCGNTWHFLQGGVRQFGPNGGTLRQSLSHIRFLEKMGPRTSCGPAPDAPSLDRWWRLGEDALAFGSRWLLLRGRAGNYPEWHVFERGSRHRTRPFDEPFGSLRAAQEYVKDCEAALAEKERQKALRILDEMGGRS
jgi:hypothetical protein